MTSLDPHAGSGHGHVIGQPSDVTRRQLLMRAGAVGAGALLLPVILSRQANAETSAARKAVRLPGFSAFRNSVRTFTKGSWYLVEVAGALPAHGMMVGITNWQQQVPVPQEYTGAMAWQLPRKPRPAANPVSLASSLRRQAIALASNGVPIFNALNNRGVDSYLTGELDDWGGHCGRGDDYHYHVAPLHLESIVGAGQPIAYALDGYPILGSTEPDGQPMAALDPATHGHVWRGNFHYHGTSTYPYTCAALYGQVTVVDDMVTPQPVPPPVRQPTDPLPGAVITGFDRTGKDGFHLRYTQGGGDYRIDYVATATSLDMTFTAPDGATRHEAYRRGAPGPAR